MKRIYLFIGFIILKTNLSGQITGSGTTNTIPIFTSSSVIGNSSITQGTGGAIGIGTLSPTPGFQLQVTGPNARFALLNSSSASTTNYAQIHFGHGTAIGQYAEFYRQNNNKIFHIFNGDGSIGLSTKYGSNYVYDLFLNSAGNIGIGTTSPLSKLSVNGKIEAEEIQVKSDVPDYVFTKYYKLLTIEELEEYINTHKVLPNIQTQEDVDTNRGMVKLGELTVSLMEKVEELTLHVIHLNKKIKEMESSKRRLKK